MVKHTQTICSQKPTNCLSVFDHCVGLARKGLSNNIIWNSAKNAYYFQVNRATGNGFGKCCVNLCKMQNWSIVMHATRFVKTVLKEVF